MAARERLAQERRSLSAEEQVSDEALAQVEILNMQLAVMRQQIARLAVALEASEAATEEQQVQIASLGQRLNAALASRVEELARYRSEFFGRLREVLGEREDIQVVGDRFVFQSDVLFASGSAELDLAGARQISQLARTLIEIAASIPPEINWILRVDGHTDRVPIATFRYPTNWALSTARAVSVVKFLIEAGVPAEHLAATGFGEFQPLDPTDGPAAYALNRRIELRLDQR
jgi:chemotaxis protein MotB